MSIEGNAAISEAGAAMKADVGIGVAAALAIDIAPLSEGL
jgi:hypothetical protein